MFKIKKKSKHDWPDVPFEVDKEDKPKKEKVVKLDCKVCEGTGLTGEPTDVMTKVCAVCDGTGDAKKSQSAFPEGTVVLTAEGQFQVVDGVLTKKETVVI